MSILDRTFGKVFAGRRSRRGNRKAPSWKKDRRLTVERMEPRMMMSGGSAGLPGSANGPPDPTVPTVDYQITGVPSQATAGQSFKVTITAVDFVTNQPIGGCGGQQVILRTVSALNGSGTTLQSLGSVTLDANGQATTTVSITKTGTDLVEADYAKENPKFPSTMINGFSDAIAVVPGPATQLILTAWSAPVVGQPTMAYVTAEDVLGNGAINVPSVALSASDGQIPSQTVYLYQGKASVPLTFQKADTLTLKAVGGGFTAYSNSIVVSNPPPAAPQLTAAPYSATQVELSWPSVKYATGYTIAELQYGLTFSDIDSVGGGATSYIVSRLGANTEYQFEVEATNTSGDSWSNAASAGVLQGLTVTAPAGVTADKPFPVTVAATDNWGHVDSNFSGSAALTTGDSQAVTPATVKLNGGTWSGNVTLAIPDATRLIATDGTLTGNTAVNVAGGITSLSTTIGYAPGYSQYFLQTGSSVTITGNGFIPGALVLFGDPGTTDPKQLRTIAEQVGATPTALNGTSLTVNVPRSAISGPIVVVDPVGADSAIGLKSPQGFTVKDYRNTFCFSFKNFSFNVTWDMVKGAFGGNQVDICPGIPFTNICWDTGIPNPLALALWGAEAIAFNGNGACYGMALASVVMSENPGMINAANGLPSGASPTIYNLQQNGALTSMIEQDLLKQWSTQMLGFMVNDQLNNPSPGSMYNDINSQLQGGNHPLIAIQGGTHHTMLAYDLEPGPQGNGDYYIDVYDSNRPFNYQGDETTQVNHLNVENASRIYVTSDGHWSFTMAGGKNCGGGMGSIQVIDDSLATQAPNMPTNIIADAWMVLGDNDQPGQGNAALTPSRASSLLDHGSNAGQIIAAPAQGQGSQGPSQPALAVRIAAPRADAVFQNLGVKGDFSSIAKVADQLASDLCDARRN